jgi:hypothetical protein
MAAIARPLNAEELQRLDKLVEETRAIASKNNSKMFRRIHQRAKLIRPVHRLRLPDAMLWRQRR